MKTSKNRAFMSAVGPAMRYMTGLGMALALLLCSAGLARAEWADRQQPLDIEADSLTHDDRNKTTTAQGRVVATQGSLLLRAGKIVVVQQPQGHHHIVLSAEGSQPVSMRQKRQGTQEYVEGQAQRIERDDSTGTTRLTGQARMRRLSGSRVLDEVAGDTIVYSDVTEVYQVTGSAGTGVTQAQAPAGRARVIITPAGAQP